MTDYSAFLDSKRPPVEAQGVEPRAINPMLYPFQRELVEWALRRGRAAIFADCGLGKSFMQIEWAKHFERVLIVAPIAVGQQTVTEAAKLGLSARRVLSPEDAPGVQITNYERLERFVGVPFDAVVLDESSILKSLDGKTRTMLIQKFSSIPYRLCCTATPAPNDVSELANHAEFLGAMSRAEMLATFFIHDQDERGWRLKGHAAGDMWRWMARWARFLRRPSDLGHEDGGWLLPELSIRDEIVPSGVEGLELGGIGKRGQARKATTGPRLEKALEVIRNTPGQWLVWCGLNAEQDALAKALGADCVSIQGSTKEEDRVALEAAWREGRARVMVTKPKVFGWGMNWQHCNQVLFLGLGDSYEEYYQAIRRCWRFGQARAVDVRIVVSDVEGAISQNVKRKEEEARAMAESIIAAVGQEQLPVRDQREDKYEPRTVDAEDYALMLGDCVERTKELSDALVGFSIYSPPFASLYTYSSSPRDMGNCRDYDAFFKHYSYLIPELLRVTKPGRRTAVHVAQVSTLKGVHGVIGWRDFRADVVKAYVAGGWIYDGEICIDKDPQAQAIRTKSKQLMFVQKERDSAWLRPAMADYILLFRHPGENPEPVKSDVTNEEWILFARPIWYGIKESGVLKNHRSAREDDDEKHICPLQLETIERCVRLWSNPGDIVLSPFAGIGSEGYVSLRFGRKFIGVELKESYFNIALRNLEQALAEGRAAPTVPTDLPAKKGAADSVSTEAA
jgi:superfamily II DNA or RNA helicase